MSPRHSRLLLAAILLVAALLRLADLSRHPFWLDEIVTVRDLKRPDLDLGQPVRLDHQTLRDHPLATWPELIENIRRQEDSPPLYFGLAWAWTRLTGLSESRLRLLSGLLGLLWVVGVYALGRVWLGPEAGLWAAALVAVHPFAVEMGREARPYSLLLLMCTLALLLLPRLDRPGRAGRLAAIGLAACLAVGILTHHFAWVFAGACLIAGWVLSPAGRFRLAAAAGLAGVWATPALATLALRLSEIQSGDRRLWVQVEDGGAGLMDWLLRAAALPKKLAIGSLDFGANLPLTMLLAIPAALLLVTLAGWGLTAAARAHPRPAAALAVLLGLPVLVTFAADRVLGLGTIQAPRYLIFLLPPLVLAVAAAIRPRSAGGVTRPALASALLAVWLAGSLVFLTSDRRGTDWRRIGAAIQQATGEGDLVLADSVWDAHLVGWYSDQPRQFCAPPTPPAPEPWVRQVLATQTGRTVVHIPFHPTAGVLPGRSVVAPPDPLARLAEHGGLVADGVVYSRPGRGDVTRYRVPAADGLANGQKKP